MMLNSAMKSAFFFLEDMSKFNEFEYLMFVVFTALEE